MLRFERISAAASDTFAIWGNTRSICLLLAAANIQSPVAFRHGHGEGALRTTDKDARWKSLFGRQVRWMYNQRWEKSLRHSNIKHDFNFHVSKERLPWHVKDLCARKTIAKSENITHHDIAYIFDGCARGRFINKVLFRAVWTKGVKKTTHLKKLTPLELSRVVESLGELWEVDDYSTGFFPGFKLLVEALLDECIERERTSFNAFRKQGIANVIHGLGYLYIQNGEFEKSAKVSNLVDVLLRKFADEQELLGCEAGDIVKVFSGCAKLGHTNLDAFAYIARFVESRIRNYVVKDLTDLVYFMGLADYADFQLLDAICTMFYLERMFPELYKNDFRNLLIGFGRVGYRNERYLGIICNKLEFGDRLGKIDMHQVPDILYGLGLLQFQREVVIDMLVEEILSKVNEYREEELSRVVSALSMLEYKNAKTWKTLGHEFSKPFRAVSCNVEQLSNIVYRFGQAGVRDDEMLGALSHHIARQRRLESFKEMQLWQIVHGFMQVGYQNETVLQALYGEISKRAKLGKFEPEELANIEHDLQELGCNLPIESGGSEALCNAQ